MATLASLMDPTSTPTCQFPIDPCSVPPPPMPDWLNVSWVEERLVNCCSWQVYRRKCLGITEGPIVSTDTPTLGATSTDTTDSSMGNPSGATKPITKETYKSGFTTPSSTESTEYSNNVPFATTVRIIQIENTDPNKWNTVPNITATSLKSEEITSSNQVSGATDNEGNTRSSNFSDSTTSNVLETGSTVDGANISLTSTNNFETPRPTGVVASAGTVAWLVPVLIIIIGIIALVTFLVWRYYKKTRKNDLDVSVYENCNYLHNKAKKKEMWAGSTVIQNKFIPTDTMIKDPLYEPVKILTPNLTNSKALSKNSTNSPKSVPKSPKLNNTKVTPAVYANEYVLPNQPANKQLVNVAQQNSLPPINTSSRQVFPTVSTADGTIIDGYSEVNDTTDSPAEKKPKRRRKKKKSKSADSKNNDIAPDESKNDLSDISHNDLDKQTSHIGGVAGDTSC